MWVCLLRGELGYFFLKGKCIDGEVSAWKDKITEMGRKISRNG
jgi:hypothetical protein